MAETLFDRWCERRDVDVAGRHRLHVLTERDCARAVVQTEIDAAVSAHYDEPAQLSARIGRLGYAQAAEVLREMLPQSKRGRSGDMGEILATESVPAVLTSFSIPVKRLRYSDSRELAMRGEDLIGFEREGDHVRFLKGEAKSRAALAPNVVEQARAALNANDGRPSPHAMGFVMKKLVLLGEEELAWIFEKHMLARSISVRQLVHLIFTLSGNDASNALEADLGECDNTIEQHAIAFRIDDHQKFVASVYDRLNCYASQR